MPCNEQPLCDEGIIRSNGAIENGTNEATPPSSSTSEIAAIEERQITEVESSTSRANMSLTGQTTELKNSGRSHIASTRSVNWQSIALPGEDLLTNPDNENCVNMESCRICLTQYRIVIVSHNQNAMCAIPLTGIDLLEAKDMVGLQISCKSGRIIKLRAENSEMACAWYKRLMQKTCISRELSTIFASKFCRESLKERPIWLRREAKKQSAYDQIKQEFLRLKLSESNWTILDQQRTFEICPTYPQYLIVPSSVQFEDLKEMASGRYYRRFPTLVWRNRRNGAVLLRSSQPSIGFNGFFGMANDRDVTLYERIRKAISAEPSSKILIIDARSYTAAWANRAKGGGFEAADSYTNAEVVFMGLPNIHNIRYSFHQLRLLLNSNADHNIFLQALQSTLWLQNIGQLFTATERCLNALCSEGVSVLVHCSDGWDRTTQIVSLCMLIADPHYRTFEGFEWLVKHQWVEFGHKFADRGGVFNSDDNEKSPVFLQFLDCVYQLWMKNPEQFEFNRRYLMKLMQHTFSGLFGTFLFNSVKEAIENGLDPYEYEPEEQRQKYFQVWAFLGKHNAEFQNAAYNGRSLKRKLDFPKILPDLSLWKEAYCCTPEELVINNPDDSLHQSTGAGSTQDICSSEKASNTLSRSQSAASLTSMHELNSTCLMSQSNHGVSSNCSTVVLSNGTSPGPGVAHLGTKLTTSESCSIGFNCSAPARSQPQLDVDGLSLIPLQLEDHMRRLFELHLGQAKLATSMPKNVPPRDGHVNGKIVNGEQHQTTRRTRNESVESSFEIVPNGDFSRHKHNSSSSQASVYLPSSLSSTSTGDLLIPQNNNSVCSRNGTLQEGLEVADGDGAEPFG